jgi:16S rRNA (guanine527-N7)-methyltransferase
LLERGAKEMNAPLTEAQVQQLDRFANLIEKWNKGMNLVSRQDIQRLVPRHLLDSLAAVPHIESNTLLDVGTGPGLPGIVLAIAKPKVAVTLWERMTRRVRFLQLVCRELGLSNVQVQERDLYDPEELGSADVFDTIVARAVAPVERLWPVLGAASQCPRTADRLLSRCRSGPGATEGTASQRLGRIPLSGARVDQ